MVTKTPKNESDKIGKKNKAAYRKECLSLWKKRRATRYMDIWKRRHPVKVVLDENEKSRIAINRRKTLSICLNPWAVTPELSIRFFMSLNGTEFNDFIGQVEEYYERFEPWYKSVYRYFDCTLEERCLYKIFGHVRLRDNFLCRIDRPLMEDMNETDDNQKYNLMKSEVIQMMAQNMMCPLYYNQLVTDDFPLEKVTGRIKPEDMIMVDYKNSGDTPDNFFRTQCDVLPEFYFA